MSTITRRAPVSPPSATAGREHCRQSDATDMAAVRRTPCRPQASGPSGKTFTILSTRSALA